MVEASGYLFQDVDEFLRKAKESLEEAKTGAPEAHDRYRGSLTSSLEGLDRICSRYKDDAEASLIKNKLVELLEELDSGKLTPEIEARDLNKIIERVHHLTEWRRISTASGRDLSLKSRRKTKEDVQKR